MSNSIDGRAIGRVISDWNACYPATTLRIDAITRDTQLVYSAQLGFSDGSSAEFDVTEDALRAPAIFPKVLTQRGPSRYSEGQWMLFDELSDGAFKVITRLMGEAESSDLATRPEMARLAGYSPKGRRSVIPPSIENPAVLPTTAPGSRRESTSVPRSRS